MKPAINVPPLLFNHLGPFAPNWHRQQAEFAACGLRGHREDRERVQLLYSTYEGPPTHYNRFCRDCCRVLDHALPLEPGAVTPIEGPLR